jgi:hypothetical protein
VSAGSGIEIGWSVGGTETESMRKQMKRLKERDIMEERPIILACI